MVRIAQARRLPQLPDLVTYPQFYDVRTALKHIIGVRTERALMRLVSEDAGKA